MGSGAVIGGILAPSAPVHQWVRGGRRSIDVDELTITFDARSRTFASMANIQPYLARNADPIAFRRLKDYIDDAIRQERPNSAAVLLTVGRRISREAGVESSAISLGADLLNKSLAKLGRVHLLDVDQADTLTLRLLFRACVLSSEAAQPRYVWHVTDAYQANDAAGTARECLIDKMRSSGLFDLSNGEPRVAKLTTRVAPIDETSTYAEVAGDIANHNYERAARGCELLVANHEITSSTQKCLKALIFANMGLVIESDRLLKIAADRASSHLDKAYSLCLRSLLASKRLKNVAAAIEYCETGIDVLSNASIGQTRRAVSVEMAWLLNANALAKALLFRSTGERRHLGESLQLERAALTVVGGHQDAEHQYLRFNLLANIAYLYEINRDYSVAAKIFDDAFVKTLGGTPAKVPRLAYRLGVLLCRSGELERSMALLQETIDAVRTEDWWILDHLWRAHAITSLMLGDRRMAIDSLDNVREIAHTERCARGADWLEKASRYFEPQRRVPVPALRGVVDLLASKVPSYCAEVDLDDYTGYYTNSVLGGYAG